MSYECPFPDQRIEQQAANSLRQRNTPPKTTLGYSNYVLPATQSYPTADVQINSITAKALVDTGSTMTIISIHLARKCNLELKKWASQPISGITGDFIEPPWSTAANITLCEFGATISNIAVMDGLPEEVILGNDWRMAARVRITVTNTNHVIITADASETEHSGNKKENQYSVAFTDRIAPCTTQIADDYHAVTEKPTHLTDSQFLQLNRTIKENKGVFADHPTDIGIMPDVEHSIHLKDDTPIRSPPHCCS